MGGRVFAFHFEITSKNIYSECLLRLWILLVQVVLVNVTSQQSHIFDNETNRCLIFSSKSDVLWQSNTIELVFVDENDDR